MRVGDRMRRRRFLALVGVGIVTWSRLAKAGDERVRKVALLLPGAESDPEGKDSVEALRRGLEERGWKIGQNLIIDVRWRISSVENANNAIAEFLSRRPDVVVTATSQTLRALLRATSELPIVFVYIYEPVAQGFVYSLARPGGNATGFTSMEVSIGAKWMELLKQLAPNVSRVAFLSNPENPGPRQTLSAVRAAASGLDVEILDTPVHTAAEIEAVTSEIGPNGGLIVPPDGFLILQRDFIIELADRYRLPAVYGLRQFATAGGLAAYGPSFVFQCQQAAEYVDRILRGERPGELPVQQPTEFDFVINLKAAKKLGLSVTPSVLISAREVIE